MTTNDLRLRMTSKELFVCLYFSADTDVDDVTFISKAAKKFKTFVDHFYNRVIAGKLYYNI
jgi:hypothetical protein